MAADFWFLPDVVDVDRRVDIAADPDTVWAALTEQDGLADWLDADVALDLRPGGVGHVVERDGTTRQVLVTEVDAPRRVAWHWWEDGGPLSTVEITVEPTPGGSQVRVHELGTADEPTATPIARPRWLDAPSGPDGPTAAGPWAEARVGAPRGAGVLVAGRR
jgi:uncharacterized protein YndB with AHSA1/START domain